MCVSQISGDLIVLLLLEFQKAHQRSQVKWKEMKESSQILEGIKLCKANNLGDG